MEQIDTARRSGLHFAAFAYNSLFERLDSRGRPAMDAQSPARAALRKHLMHYVRQRVARGDARSTERG